MTIEEITRTLQTVAENQAKHDEMHSRHSADIAEIDKMLSLSLQSQNRYDERLATISDIMHDLADKHLKNEERFAELAEARRVNEARLDKMEASYQLLEEFVRDFKNETEARQDKLDSAFHSLGEFVMNFRRETNGYFAETDKKLAALAESQARTDEQIKMLITAQARTDEQLRSLMDRNGSKKPKARVKKAPKKTAKKKDR
jgi:chromosome segregation ATPase